VATTVAVMSAVVLAACNSDPAGVEFEVIEEVAFDPSLNIDLSAMTKLPEGVYIQDRVAGAGAGLAAGNTAWVYYELYLRTGQPIQNGLYSFVLQASPPQVIPGWDVGLEGMTAGGTRLMIIPPELGYGEQTLPGIPGGSILVFEVELDSIT
jgi:FKBP-type peptidyl-prolyl cis-trans isomerase